ncbi:MAG: NAD(P)H-dependent glycerol-3-phosphate dehydrogenase [Gemmatimonadota bacterium]|nr:NAD(P)H-dependent glycerol-3-phosphate dehydrogenase [Gemmatimonadota bacterium]
MRACVLGAGSWGTALADLLARNGHSVALWAHEASLVESIARERQNSAYLPGVTLAPGLLPTADLAAAVGDAELLVSAVPSHVTRDVLGRVARYRPDSVVLACASKGIETGSLKLMSDVCAEALPAAHFVALSGPSFAVEVAERQPTAVVAAGPAEAARLVQAAFAAPEFRVYTQSDVIGVEVGGSLKNVIAIAAGVLVGLGLGHNPRAALVTRGLAEMCRLGVALGAHSSTFSGLAGMGDLILTTGGPLSRNRSLGEALARGETVDHWRATHRAVAEGVNTTLAAVALASRHAVDMPITTEVHAILFEGKPPRRAVRDLMERDLKPELTG